MAIVPLSEWRMPILTTLSAERAVETSAAAEMAPAKRR
jgi:hypothetical protein